MLWSEMERFGRFFDPWKEFERMRHSLAAARAATQQTTDFPLVNVWASADAATVTTEIPGIDPKTLDISVVDNTLTIRGSRQPETLGAEDTFHRRERWYGQFAKTVQLPFSIEANNVEAKFTKGVLYISLPRAEADKPKKIMIKSV